MGRRGRKGEAISLLTMLWVCAPEGEDCPTITALGDKGGDDRCRGLRARQHILAWPAQAVAHPSRGGGAHTMSATWPQRQMCWLVGSICGTEKKQFHPTALFGAGRCAPTARSKHCDRD